VSFFYLLNKKSMNASIILSILFLLNFVSGFYNYRRKNYKTAMLNFFIAGTLISALIYR
jgi:hypothetical protein